MPATRSLLAMVGALLLPALALPASPARRLLGTVTDRSGVPVEDVKVKLFDVGGEAPEFRADRSYVNSEGRGSEARQAQKDLPWDIDGGLPPEGQRKLLKELETDDDGVFVYSTPFFVDSLLVQLERPGYQTTLTRVSFPLGTTKLGFTLKKPDEPPADTAVAIKGTAKERALAHFEQGVALMSAKDWGKGRAAFAEAVKLAPELDNAWLNLAIASFQIEDYEGALAAAEKLLELKPDHPVAKMMIADAKARLGATPVPPDAAAEGE